MSNDKKLVYKKHRNQKVNIPMFMSVVLFWLTLVTTHFTGGLYAKYVVKGSGEDSARVIKFGTVTITEDGDFATGTAYFRPGITLKKDVTVAFTGGESDVYIFAVMETPGWKTEDNINFTDVKLGHLTWSVNTAESHWQYLDTDGDKHIYYQYLDTNKKFGDKLIANDGRIEISANAPVEGKSANVIYKEYQQEIAEGIRRLEINITAYAVQAGGFENAEKAWESLTT